MTIICHTSSKKNEKQKSHSKTSQPLANPDTYLYLSLLKHQSLIHSPFLYTKTPYPTPPSSTYSPLSITLTISTPSLLPPPRRKKLRGSDVPDYLGWCA